MVPRICAEDASSNCLDTKTAVTEAEKEDAKDSKHIKTFGLPSDCLRNLHISIMDAIPPSYEYAIMKDALAIIANYIPSADLCSASLVSRRWHAIFNPHLWGDPASHFGTENDAVYGNKLWTAYLKMRLKG